MLLKSIENFLKGHRHSQKPFLLALSGGPDSLCLFYLLIKLKIDFHVAHVNHRWRKESDQEAACLRSLAASYGLSYYEAVLDPLMLKGNLEAACREERLNFFKELCDTHGFEGVLLGHQQDDHAETVLKRIFEGAHWHHLRGLQTEAFVKGLRLLRPLLGIPKSQLVSYLKDQNIAYIEDPTNQDNRYLRARMRSTLLPFLNEKFGKKVESSLVHLSQELEEIHHYFYRKNAKLLEEDHSGFLGKYWELGGLHAIEIKHLLSMLFQQEGIFASRDQLDRMAKGLHAREADLQFIFFSKKIEIDRGCLFITQKEIPIWNETIPLQEGVSVTGTWQINVRKETFSAQLPMDDFFSVWQGRLKAQLPLDAYLLAPPSLQMLYRPAGAQLKKWWTAQKVPAFLRQIFPVLLCNDQTAHEFLTGKGRTPIQEGEGCLKVEIIKLKPKDPA